MKYIAILFLAITMPSYACKEFDELRLHINHMIDNQQYEEAAQYLADKDKTNISEGYRVLAAFIGAYYELKNYDII